MGGRLLILGTGGHGRVAADAALAAGRWNRLGFVDNTPGMIGTRIMDLPVLAATPEAVDHPDFAGAAVHVALGENATRRRICEILAGQGTRLATICHPSAVISPFARIGAGVSVMAGAVIQPGTEIGDGAIVNTGVRIDHDCRVGAYAHISPGAVLAGNVTIGAESWIGAGATIRNGIAIGEGLVVGVGAAVVSDLAAVPGTRFGGVPARRL